MDLGRQFTRRHEDEPSRASGPAAIAPPDDAVDHGQPEGGRLARTCLSTREGALTARKSSCGLRLMTFSGQVALHNPHCTQASSAKRSIGRSLSSRNAPVGQAETQERHSVQLSESISIE